MHAPAATASAFEPGVHAADGSFIQGEAGTIDKYMGDCVMAFWGAPVPAQDHAACAVRAALGMARAAEQLNQEHRAQGLPEIGVGIGLNTGLMCVGDMGSNIRLSYTVIGDAVNWVRASKGCARPTALPSSPVNPPTAWHQASYGKNWTVCASKAKPRV
jgi:class 3 adenylate cyclase